METFLFWCLLVFDPGCCFKAIMKACKVSCLAMLVGWWKFEEFSLYQKHNPVREVPTHWFIKVCIITHGFFCSARHLTLTPPYVMLLHCEREKMTSWITSAGAIKTNDTRAAILKALIDDFALVFSCESSISLTLSRNITVCYAICSTCIALIYHTNCIIFASHSYSPHASAQYLLFHILFGYCCPRNDLQRLTGGTHSALKM